MPEVTESILLSVKKLNNVAPDYTAFDADFILYINAGLADLNQVGIGPGEGLTIESEEDTWDDLIGEEPRLNAVKTFLGLKTRLMFDPPASSFAIEMMQGQLDEHLNRIMWAQEDIDASVEVPLDDPATWWVVDGGGA